MANETLIAYQNELKQDNLNQIAVLQQTVATIPDEIARFNANIDNLNAQKTDCQNKITELENGNVLIDQTIAILFS